MGAPLFWLRSTMQLLERINAWEQEQRGERKLPSVQTNLAVIRTLMV